MSCGPTPGTFRLLDGYIGWEADVSVDGATKGLEGLDTVEGIALARRHPLSVDPAAVDACLPPARLARGCGPCEWYLVTRDRPVLARRDRCSDGFRSVFGSLGRPGLLVEPVGIAVRRHRAAIADRGTHRVWVVSQRGERIVAVIPFDVPGPLAFAPWGELFVSDDASGTIVRYGPGGELHGPLRPGLTLGEGRVIDRLGFDSACGLWVVTRSRDVSDDPAYEVWHASRTAVCMRPDDAPGTDPPLVLCGAGDDPAKPLSEADLINCPIECFGPFGAASAADLARSVPSTRLTAVDPASGFCFQEHGPDGYDIALCFDWQGAVVLGEVVHAPAKPARAAQGQLLTVAIDSGLPRCRWHRVEIDADLPFGTSLETAVASAETVDSGGPVYPTPDAQWTAFPGGRPHPDEWRTLPSGAMDALIDQPPGRYLYVRLRLTGDGHTTPLVRRVRLDLPRSTSLDRLPSVYREDPEAEDFSERFLSLFDSSVADLDRAILRAPALLDSQGVPDEVLPWLGSFLDVVFDPSWSAERRRALLAAVPELYRLRGTRAGLIGAIEKMTGVTVALEELPLERSWGALGGPGAPGRLPARLRSTRLFGRSRARFRLGSSPLDGAPLRSFGNPDQDPLSELAYRFRVLAPPDAQDPQGFRSRLGRAVASQKPAHTVATVRVGGTGFLLGSWSAVGVDTAFVPLAAPVLGKAGNVRLGCMSVVWPGPGGGGVPLRLGTKSAIGIDTVLE